MALRHIEAALQGINDQGCPVHYVSFPSPLPLRMACASNPTRQIGDLLISPSAVQTTKTDGRYTAPPGFHYVRVAVAVRNVGNKAICTYLSAHLGTSLSGGRKLGSMTVANENSVTPRMSCLLQMCVPGFQICCGPHSQ